MDSQPSLKPSSDAAAPASSTSAASAPNPEISTVLRQLGPIGPLALLSLTLPAVGGFLLLATMKDYVGPWLQSHGDAGVWIYIAGFAVSSGLAILPTYAQAILGGWAFQFWVGFPAAMAGFTAGAILGYVIARVVSGNRVERIVADQPRWKAVYDALLRAGVWRTMLIVTLVRIPPNSPFSITNLILAAARVPFWTYLIGTVVGMAPRTAAVVYYAARATELSFTRSRGWGEFLIGIAVTLVVLAIIGRIAQRALQNVVDASNAGQTSAAQADTNVSHP